MCATACSTTNVVALVRVGESGGGTRPYFSVVAAAIERDQSFGSQDPFSVGVEEELFLVDPITGRQINSSAAVLERLGKVSGKVERELHACQVELITSVHRTVGDAVRELGELRRAVIRTGAGLLGSGTHPSADEGDAVITDKERYERIRFLLGDAVVTPVGGLHIHVGMPDAERAIKAFNGLRRDLPLLQALAANSPFRHGRDTGLASARELSLRGWPRSGAPRALRDFADFCDLTGALTRAADVPDYTWFWWKLRPHPRLGTVEIRALDAQACLTDTAALVALVHCLARDAADAEAVDGPAPEVLEEGMFRAARFGIRGEIPDARGRRRPVSDLLADALARIRDRARELGCVQELAALPELLKRGGGAADQRATYEIAGIDAVLRELMQQTAAAYTGERELSAQAAIVASGRH
ncbi:MAG: YbdK family carboxylate-amine ligase [Solirubrobacterales bacterium]|nr:YbdK family carboxylate-amine ligase [Solirubrobacterales bacterium]